jgi:hypothetical protein
MPLNMLINAANGRGGRFWCVAALISRTVHRSKVVPQDSYHRQHYYYRIRGETGCAGPIKVSEKQDYVEKGE